MNVYNATSFVPAKAPRGAIVAGGLFAAAWNLVSRLWATEPRRLTPAEEAEEVRAMARDVYATDPGFANDLFAAADRHEAGAR